MPAIMTSKLAALLLILLPLPNYYLTVTATVPRSRSGSRYLSSLFSSTMIMIMMIMDERGPVAGAALMTCSYSKRANLNYFCLITLTFRPFSVVPPFTALALLRRTVVCRKLCNGFSSFKINNVYLLF